MNITSRRETMNNKKEHHWMNKAKDKIKLWCEKGNSRPSVTEWRPHSGWEGEREWSDGEGRREANGGECGEETRGEWEIVRKEKEQERADKEKDELAQGRWDKQGGRDNKTRKKRQNDRGHSDNKTKTGREIDKYNKYTNIQIHNNANTVKSHKEAYKIKW